MIIGELACGNLKNRKEIMELIAELPSADVAEQDEVLNLIEKHLGDGPSEKRKQRKIGSSSIFAH
jgi:hypothetical protein